MQHTVDITRTQASTAAVTRFHVAYSDMATIGEHMSHAFGTVMAALGRDAIHSDGPALAYYEPGEDGFDVAAGFRVASDVATPPGLERLDIRETEAAHTTHLGAYSGLSAAYDDLRAEVEHAGRRLAEGPMWEEYWSGPETPEDQTRTEVYWPLSPSTES